MNSVTLIGNLTRDPEIKGSGESRVCRMRVAEWSGSRDATPLYIDVAAFGRQAESCRRYLRKGRPIAVSGRLRFREWEGEDGGRRSGYSIAADRVQFLASAHEQRAEDGQQELTATA